MKLTTKKLAAAIGLSCVMAAPLALAEDGRHFEILGGAGYTLWDTDRDIDDSGLYGVGVGYALNKTWTLEAWWTKSEDLSFDNDVPYGADAIEYRLDALYHLTDTGTWRPYLVAGVSENTFDLDRGADNIDETRVNLGIGVKRLLGDHFSVRGDIRAFNSLDEEQTDLVAQVAVSYLFGQSSSKKVADSDGDGVPDSEDACPNTPAGAPVDATGCPLDSDGDGVPDYKDQCPGTDSRLKVDEVGCPVKLEKSVSMTVGIEFDFDSAKVKPEYNNEIKKVADFMHQYEGVKVEVQGHTDAVGAEDYNQNLSEKRAASVGAVLEQQGITADRIRTKGYGESMPIADNDTKEGRAQNRRVVAEVEANVEKLEKR